MTISIITVSHRSDRHLPRYVDSFLASGSSKRQAAIEFVVVENSGQHTTQALLEPLRTAGFRVTYVEAENRGFGAGCNAGVARATGDTLVFANPDIAFVDPLDAIDARQDSTLWGTVAQQDDQGGSYSFDALPEYKTVLGELRRRYRGLSVDDPAWRDRLYPVGSFFIVAADLFRRAGGFDERFFMYHEEAELSRRLHSIAGPPVLFDDIRIIHEAFGSQSSRDATLREETRGLLTYARITGKSRVLMTRALTQAVLAPISAGARRRLWVLIETLRASKQDRA